jgi:hypothetical protein
MVWCAEVDIGSSTERTLRMMEEIEITVVDLYGERPALGFCFN